MQTKILPLQPWILILLPELISYHANRRISVYAGTVLSLEAGKAAVIEIVDCVPAATLD
jgi:hypothetical protein